MEEYKDRAPAVTAATRIIKYMSEVHEAVTLADISTGTRINKNMISRVLSVLIEEGWVLFDNEIGKFSLSLQLFRLGSAALAKKTLSACAGTYLKRLSDLTHECIQLAVLHNNSAVYIAQIESKNVAGVKGQIGGSYSLDTSSHGKILKAFILKDPAMAAERAAGYALDNEEYTRGVICLSAPVYDYTGDVIAAMGIASLTVNHTLEEMTEKYLDILLREAGALSRELGYRSE